LELIFGNFSLSELVKIVEELFDSNSFHDDVVLKSGLDIVWIVGDLNSLLEVSIVDNIQILGVALEEGRTSVSQLTVVNMVNFLWIFSNVSWEDVL
jgi:hypothetical protein